MWRGTFGTLVSSAVLLLLAATSTLGSSDALVIQTTSGTFRGVATANETEHWLGIPFAQPPVGSLRFKAPVPFKNRSKAVQDASAFGNACPQVPSDGLGAPQSEDCLFLNVSDPCIFQDHTQSPRRIRYSDQVTSLSLRSFQYWSGSMCASSSHNAAH